MSNPLDNPTSFGYSFDSMPEFIKHPIQTVKRLFDWDVKEQELTTFGPHVYGKIKGWKAIVRSGGESDDRILHVAPSSYQIISNAQFEDIVSDYEKIGCQYVAHGTFNNGRQLWVQLECPDQLAPWLIGGVDKGKTKITLVTSHNSTLLLKVLLMMERLFCANQFPMISKATDAGFAIKHTKSAEHRISDARGQIRAIGELSKQAVESFELLNATPINRWKNEQFFADLFGMKKEIRTSTVNGIEVPSPEPVYSGKALNMLDALGEAYSHELQSNLGHNAWRLLNAVTYYVDHSPHISEGRRDKGYAMTGGGVKVKCLAYNQLLMKAKANGHNNGWQPSGITQ